MRCGIPAPLAAEALSAAVGSRAVNAVVVVGVLDQADGLARELADDFGINASAVLLDAIGHGEQLPRAVRRAHFLLTTPGGAASVRRLGERTMCTVRSAALPYPHTVIVIEPDGRSRGGAFVTERIRGLLAIRQAPGPFGTCPRARRVFRLGLKLMGRRRHRNQGDVSPQRSLA